MEKFKVGDKFIPRKERVKKDDPIRWPSWMDELDGKILTVDNVNERLIFAAMWSFHPDWCVKVEIALATDN